MRHQIQTVVQIFRANPECKDNEILKRIIDTGIDQRVAVQLLLLLPLAYGRVALSDLRVVFPNTYVCLGKGDHLTKGRLDALPLWAQALDFAKQDLEPSFAIASRSPEINAANAALSDGKKLEQLVWGPPTFLWPIETISDQDEIAKRPNWLRRIWDDPAEHSVTCEQRIVTRVVMIIALLIGLLAVGLVAYYVIQLRRESANI